MNYHIMGRFWIGAGIGSVIGQAITLMVSYFVGDGQYLAVMPQLAQYFGREVDGALVQFLLFALIGVVFAEAGILFQMERFWFPVKCVLHFLATAVFYLPFLWLCYLNYENRWLILGLVLVNVLVTYLVTWLMSYFAMRAEVKEINRRIGVVRSREEKSGR